MTPPNEPGRPGPGHGPGDPGAANRTGEVTPPWQRGVARQRPAPSRPPAESANRSPGAEARPSRPAAGTATTRPGKGAEPAHADEQRPETRDAYPSELPDLSGPARPAPRKPAPQPVEPARASAPSRVQVARRGAPLRASMQIRRIDPWSTLKASLILSVALFFVWMIAVALLYLVLGGMGVWSKLNSNVGDLLTNSNASDELVSAGSIFGGATLIGLVNIVLLTAMATLGAFVYNMTADLVGGVEVTLADRE